MSPDEIRQSLSAKQGFFYGYVVVIAALFIMIITYGTRLSYGVFFKPMAGDFGWSRALTSGALSFSMLMQGFSGIPMGRLNDRLGPRLVITICGFLLGVGFLLTSQINSIWQLYLLQAVIVGIGMGGIFVPLNSTIARWFLKRRNVMTGIVQAGIGIGTFIVPPVANRLISIYDWRPSYLILGALVLVVVILVAQFLRRDPMQKGQVPYGAPKGGEPGLKLEVKGYSLKEAVRTGQFWMLSAMFFSTGFCVLALQVHIVPHATDLGISPATAANILAATGAATVLGNIILGGAADRLGNRQVFAISLILMAAGLFWLVWSKGVWMLYASTALFSFGYGATSTSLAPLTARLFGLKSLGLILGVLMNGFTIGATVGPILTGYIFDVRGNYQVAFLICAGISLVGLVLTLLLRPIGGEQGIKQRPI